MLDMKDKRVLVVGLGASGMAAAKWLLRQGARVKVTEKQNNHFYIKRAEQLLSKGAQVELGTHSQGFLSDSDLAVVSPGISMHEPVINWLKKGNIPIVSEIELGYLYCPCPIIAVTGTNGKTTVSTLLDGALRLYDRRVHLAGNIGKAFCSVLNRVGPRDWVVLEISSFQLETINHFQPHIGILLNIDDDHLDRHSSLKEYLDIKMRLFKNQTSRDWAVLDSSIPYFKNISRTIPSRVICFNSRSSSNPNGEVVEKVIDILGYNTKVLKKYLDNFKGLEHRIEYVSKLKGRTFINDSKATNVSAARWAVSRVKPPIILIAGGQDKNLDFSECASFMTDKVRELILIGDAKDKIAKAVEGKISFKMADTLEDAVCEAFGASRRGDSILLSPMCASFDMFRDYKHRGKVFKSAVKRIEAENI